MRLLVMGGVKTGNVLNVIMQRYKTSISYTKEENLCNFSKIVLRGDTFDRAIIFEQSINEDGTMMDEAKQRENISSFVEQLTSNFRNYEIIFVCENEAMARVILQETTEIAVWSKILVKKPKYFAKFFTDLVCYELKDFDRELVFDGEKLNKILEEENEEEEIIWSDEVEHVEGEILGGVTETEIDIDIDLDEWGADLENKDIQQEEKQEEQPVEVVETSEEIREQVELDEAEQRRIKASEERKKGRLRGLLGKMI